MRKGFLAVTKKSAGKRVKKRYIPMEKILILRDIQLIENRFQILIQIIDILLNRFKNQF